MKRWNKINSLQYGIMMFFILNSATLGICMNIYITSYLTPIIGFIMGFIIIFIFTKFLDYKPELNIYEKINHFFGKLGIIINIFLLIIVYIFIIIISIIIAFIFFFCKR